MFPLLQNSLIQQRYNLSPPVHKLQKLSMFDVHEGIDMMSFEDVVGSIELMSSGQRTDDDNNHQLKAFANKKQSLSSHKLSPQQKLLNMELNRKFYEEYSRTKLKRKGT